MCFPLCNVFIHFMYHTVYYNVQSILLFCLLPHPSPLPTVNPFRFDSSQTPYLQCPSRSLSWPLPSHRLYKLILVTLPSSTLFLSSSWNPFGAYGDILETEVFLQWRFRTRFLTRPPDTILSDIHSVPVFLPLVHLAITLLGPLSTTTELIPTQVPPPLFVNVRPRKDYRLEYSVGESVET